jgi:anti-sigma regulatory factor (Ser/Thr protein kinase)
MDSREQDRLSDEVRVRIAADDHLVSARAEARALAVRLGFTRTDATLIATAVSEIARNIVLHAGSGEIVMKSLADDTRCGIEVTATDTGPGIRDVASVLAHGYASRGGLGLGLPGARRLMDEFAIDSDVDRGTIVTMKKWRVRDELERLRDRRRANR